MNDEGSTAEDSDWSGEDKDDVTTKRGKKRSKNLRERVRANVFTSVNGASRVTRATTASSLTAEESIRNLHERNLPSSTAVRQQNENIICYGPCEMIVFFST